MWGFWQFPSLREKMGLIFSGAEVETAGREEWCVSCEQVCMVELIDAVRE